MEILYTLISFAALCVYSLFIGSTLKVQSSLTPLIAVSLSMVWFVLFGMFGLLVIGGYVYFVGSAVIALLLLLKKIPISGISLWFGGFMAIGALMIVFFGVREPLLNSWDEFSFWGTAVKLSKLTGELPLTAEIGWPWVTSQKAGLIVLGYLFEFFGEYKQWRIFIGLNVLAMAVFSAFLTLFKEKMKAIGVLLLGILFLTPYIFTIYREQPEPSNVYMNAHSDIPMAWLFCGLLVLYYVLAHQKRSLWPLVPVMAALVMTRDTALTFALITWGIIAVDLLFINKEVFFLKLSGIRAKILHIAVLLATILGCFFGWSRYIANATGVDPVGNVGGTEELGMSALLLEGLMQLFGIGRTEKFDTIMSGMVDAFFNLPLTMIGTGFMATIFILALLVVAIISTDDKIHRHRCISFSILSTLGLVAYNIFLGFTFVFVFRDEVSDGLIGYERYVYPYYTAWFAVSIFLLALSVASSSKRFFLLTRLALVAVLAVFCVRYFQHVPPGMSFVDYHDGYLYEREKLVETAEDVVETLGAEEDGNIFFVSQGDNGNRWFQYSGDLLPLQLEYSFGGGTMSLPATADPENPYNYELSPSEFTEYLIENECEYVFVERSDAGFVSGYSELFSDGLSLSSQGASVLYRVSSESPILQLIGEVGK